MENIVFILKFSDDTWALNKANNYLAKGWRLLHVGTETSSEQVNDGSYPLTTAYVVGANQEQYDEYLKEQDRINNDEDLSFLFTSDEK
jgi:hypothetical protein